MTAHDLVMIMIREVLYTTGITATAGIGTNLYLAQLAMEQETAVDLSALRYDRFQ